MIAPCHQHHVSSPDSIAYPCIVFRPYGIVGPEQFLMVAGAESKKIRCRQYAKPLPLGELFVDAPSVSSAVRVVGGLNGCSWVKHNNQQFAVGRITDTLLRQIAIFSVVRIDTDFQVGIPATKKGRTAVRPDCCSKYLIGWSRGPRPSGSRRCGGPGPGWWTLG